LWAASEIQNNAVRDFTVSRNAAAHVEKPDLQTFRVVFAETSYL
jgi:hypothetical protein